MKFSYHYLFFAILIKLSISLLLLLERGYPETSITEIACTGDCIFSYLRATKNIIEHGQFTIYQNLAPYSGRMPGYELVFILSTIFSGNSEVSFLFVIIFQSVIAGISMYFLAHLSYSIFNSKPIAILTYGLYGISTYVSLWDIVAWTESLATSVFIIAFALLFDQRYNRSTIITLLIGSLLLFTVLLRQYILPFFFLWTIYIVYIEYSRAKSIKVILVKTMLFILPFVCFELYWVTRNYQQQNQFIPLVNSLYGGYDSPEAKGEDFYFSPKMKALAGFVQSWGGDLIWWNPKAEITAFISSPPNSHLERQAKLNSLPSYIYTSQYNKDSLINIQKNFQEKQSTHEDAIVKSLNTYAYSLKQDRPVYYYFVAPCKLLSNFVFHSGTYNLFKKKFNNLSFYKKIIKIFYSCLYFAILILGFLGIFLLLSNSSLSFKKLILIGTSIYILLLLSFVIRRIEYRHFVFAYPYFVILSAYFIIQSKYLLGLQLKNISRAF